MPERAEAVHPLKLASLLLQYPTQALREVAALAPELELAPARGLQAQRLRALCEWYAATPLGELERHYVEAFDFSKSSSLHLTYHVHGDSRRRGLALLRLKQAYRAAGFELPADELPDYLPLMLEFAALTGPAGLELLEEHRVALELVRASLARQSSRFELALDAVIAALPRLTAHKLARVRRLAAEGPPYEEVGLEPFAPPEVMPASGAEVTR